MALYGGMPVATPSGPFAAEPDPDASTLYDDAVHLLAAVNTVFGQAGVKLPTRQYVTAGSAVNDCEQVVVAFQQVYIGPPGDEAGDPQRCDGPRSLTVQLSITRCVPTIDSRGNPPAPSAIQEAARKLMIDSWIVLNTLPAIDLSGGMIVTVEAGDAEGGMQSMYANITTGVW